MGILLVLLYALFSGMLLWHYEVGAKRWFWRLVFGVGFISAVVTTSLVIFYPLLPRDDELYSFALVPIIVFGALLPVLLVMRRRLFPEYKNWEIWLTASFGIAFGPLFVALLIVIILETLSLFGKLY